MGFDRKMEVNPVWEALPPPLSFTVHFAVHLTTDSTYHTGRPPGRTRNPDLGSAEWYRVDLLLFRRLRCLAVIDLRIGKFTFQKAREPRVYRCRTLPRSCEEIHRRRVAKKRAFCRQRRSRQGPPIAHADAGQMNLLFELCPGALDAGR